MQARPFLIVLIAVVLQSLVAIFLLENFSGEFQWGRLIAEDSRGYLLVAHFFNGSLDSLGELPQWDIDWLQYRKFNPLFPLIVVGIAKALPFSVSLEEIFFWLNLFLYVLTAIIFLRVAATVLEEKNALFASLLFATSLPVIIWELPAMLEASAFFFAALNLWGYLWFREEERLQDFPVTTFLLPLGVFLSLAILIKPTLLVFSLFWGFLLLWRRQVFKGILLALIVVTLCFSVYFALSLTPADFLTYGERRHWGVVYFVNAFVFNYHFGLIFLLWGIFLIGRDVFGKFGNKGDGTAFNNERLTEIFFLHFLPSFLIFFLFVHNPRLLFLTYPFVLLVVMHLAQRMFEKRMALFTVAYCVTSNLLAFLYLNITRVHEIRTLEDLSRLLGS